MISLIYFSSSLFNKTEILMFLLYLRIFFPDIFESMMMFKLRDRTSDVMNTIYNFHVELCKGFLNILSGGQSLS